MACNQCAVKKFCSRLNRMTKQVISLSIWRYCHGTYVCVHVQLVRLHTEQNRLHLVKRIWYLMAESYRLHPFCGVVCLLAMWQHWNTFLPSFFFLVCTCPKIAFVQNVAKRRKGTAQGSEFCRESLLFSCYVKFYLMYLNKVILKRGG